MSMTHAAHGPPVSATDDGIPPSGSNVRSSRSHRLVNAPRSGLGHLAIWSGCRVHWRPTTVRQRWPSRPSVPWWFTPRRRFPARPDTVHVRPCPVIRSRAMRLLLCPTVFAD